MLAVRLGKERRKRRNLRIARPVKNRHVTAPVWTDVTHAKSRKSMHPDARCCDQVGFADLDQAGHSFVTVLAEGRLVALCWSVIDPAMPESEAYAG